MFKNIKILLNNPYMYVYQGLQSMRLTKIHLYVPLKNCLLVICVMPLNAIQRNIHCFFVLLLISIVLSKTKGLQNEKIHPTVTEADCLMCIEYLFYGLISFPVCFSPSVQPKSGCLFFAFPVQKTPIRDLCYFQHQTQRERALKS